MNNSVYATKTETRYKLDGKWWVEYNVDKVVTFEDLDYGGFAYGVILSLVDGNELRVISERAFGQLKPEEVDLDPAKIVVAVESSRETYKNPFTYGELLDVVLEDLEWSDGGQLNCTHCIGDGDKVVYFFYIKRGAESQDDLLDALERSVIKLGMTIKYVKSVYEE